MKMKLFAIALAMFASCAIAAPGEGRKSDPGYGDGGTAQPRQIDACFSANTSVTIPYENGAHVKPCEHFTKYDGNPLPEQKFKAPFR